MKTLRFFIIMSLFFLTSFSVKAQWPDIVTETDLIEFRNAINNGTIPNRGAGETFNIMADIELTQPWIKINEFRGTLNGNFHKLSNFNITSTAGGGDQGPQSGSTIAAININAATFNPQGLVGILNGGTIRNLGIASGTITSNGSCAGAFAGHCIGGGVIEVCFNKASLYFNDGNARSRYGGIVGSIENGRVSYCYNEGTIAGGTISAPTTKNLIGGIVGAAVASANNTVTIEHCYNKGTVYSTQYGGGIAGLVLRGAATGTARVRNCYNIAPINGGAWIAHLQWSNNGGGATVSMANCYYLAGIAGNGGEGAVNAISTSEAVFKDPDMPASLNNGQRVIYNGVEVDVWIMDNIIPANNGFPILFYQYVNYGQPVVQTGAVTDIQATEATLQGMYMSIDNPTFVGFHYKKTTDDNWTPVEATFNEDGTFRVTVSGLAPSTSYEYKAVVTFNDGQDVEEGNSREFTTFATCRVPVLGTLTALLGGTTVSVSWTDPNLSATEWLLSYKKSNVSEWTEDLVTDNPFIIEGLDPVADYEIRVRTKCTDTDISLYSEIKTVKTECGTVNLPFYEGFTSTSTPNCWTNIRTAGTSNPGTFTFVTSGTNPNPGVPRAGTHMAMFNAYSYSSGVRAILVTPPINNLQGAEVNFWMYRDNTGSQNDLINVYANSTNTTTAGGTLLRTIHRRIAATPTESANGWYNYSATIPLTGEYSYVIFEGVSVYGYNIYIDEINIYSCVPPQNITAVTSLTADSEAIVTWTPGKTETQWAIEYKLSTATEWEEDITDVPTYTLTDLSPWDICDIRVRAICSPDDISNPATVRYVHVQPIANETDLITFRNFINNNTIPNKGAGMTFHIVEDIELVNNWVKIDEFRGTLDGNFHKLDNFNLNHTGGGGDNSNNWNPQGFVGILSGGTIKNLGINSGSVSSNGTFVAAFAGRVVSGGVIEACYNGATVESTVNIAQARVGGIAGFMDNSTIRNCYNKGNISNTTPTRRNNVGGIVGGADNNSRVDNCYNRGAISGGDNIAGISSNLWPNSLVINCYSTGAVTGTGTNVTAVCRNENNSQNPSITNSYFLQGINKIGTDQSISKDTSELKALAPVLNGTQLVTWDDQLVDIWYRDYKGINDGYPILYYQFLTDLVPYVETHAVTDITSTSAMFHGLHASAGISDFIGFQYRETETENDWKFLPASNNMEGILTALAFNLASSTTFEYQAIAIHNNRRDTVKGNPIMTFTTRDFCWSPTNLTVQISEGNAEITWEANNGETEWILSYRNSIDNPWIDETITNIPSYTLTGLTDFKNYSIKVKAICEPDNHSDYSDEYTGVVIYYNLYGGNCYVNGRLHTPEDNTFFYSAYETTFIPVDGYRIARVVINGIDMGMINQFNFYLFADDQYVDIYVEKIVYNISTVAYGAGTITPGRTINTLTDNYVFTVTPSQGHHIDKVLINEIPEDVTNPADYTKTIPAPILSDYTIEAYFKPIVCMITASVGEGGTITPHGTIPYNWGTSPAYTITADMGYYIASLLVDGEEETLNNKPATYVYQFNPLQGEHTIEATFAKITYTIMATAGQGGNISPVDQVTVDHGDNVTFTITPNLGWDVENVQVNGVSIGARTTYVFPSVIANHTINATFVKKIYTITAIESSNGTITPSGKVNYEYQDSQTYTVTANTGYLITSVTVDGIAETIPANTATYSRPFNSINANHVIAATFGLKSHTITVIQPANATITPATTTLNHGSDMEFTITPATGYRLTEVRVNGTAVTSTPNVFGVAKYTFRNITENHNITASTERITHTITVNSGTGGTISPATTQTVNHGDNITFTITPNASYETVRVLVDGIPVGIQTSYTFTNVTGNRTIAADFRLVFCPMPTFLHAVNIDTTSATLLWNSTDALKYELQWSEYKNTPFDFTTVPDLTVAEYQLNRLTPGTRYVWRIKAICSIEQGHETDYSAAVTFTTHAVTPSTPPTGIGDVTKDNIQVYSYRTHVYIVNETGVNIEEVSIFDIYGRKVYQGSVNSNREEIALQVSDGTYMVRLLTTDGMKIYKVNILK